MPPHRNPILFREAWDAIRALIRDPDDTPQVFRIIRALSGNSQERSFQRFLRSEHGPTILAARDAHLLLAAVVGVGVGIGVVVVVVVGQRQRFDLRVRLSVLLLLLLMLLAATAVVLLLLRATL